MLHALECAMPEIRTLIELSDIIAAEFECSKCGAKQSLPLNRPFSQLTQNCPVCRNPWFDEDPNRFPDNPSVADSVMRVFNSLQKLTEREDVRARVRIQIREHAGR